MVNVEDVLTYVDEENIRFIRLAFCDVAGRQKNITILPDELPRAFSDGISFDASAIRGFTREAVKSDLFLMPDPATLSLLPWQPASGKVARLFCGVRYPDGSQFPADSRYLLKAAVEEAQKEGVACNFGAEVEFYLLRAGEDGAKTGIPFDQAGYMDVAPEDRGEQVRREICFTLLDMGIRPESSHHEEGPGQNEIDFRYSDALSAADNVQTFKTVVSTIAMRSGLFADFGPKPLPGRSGNGMHINMSVQCGDGVDRTEAFMAGILAHIREMTAFLNPSTQSYERLGEMKAPRYVTWSPENRSQLIRIPAARGEYRRIELRSPDPCANPYLAYALLIRAGLDGIRRELKPAPPTNLNLYRAEESVLKTLTTLPGTLEEAMQIAGESAWIRSVLPGIFL